MTYICINIHLLTPLCNHVVRNSSADCRPDVGTSGYATLKAFDPQRYQTGTTQLSVAIDKVMSVGIGISVVGMW